MRILFVGMPFSIHVVRWISQINNLNWEIHFFSSYPYAQPHPNLTGIIYHDYFYTINKKNNQSLRYRTFNNWPIQFFTQKSIQKWFGKLYRFSKLQKSHQCNLEQVIKSIKPDIIHSMESQHAGYMVSHYFNNLNNRLKPKWIHSTFGIDLDYFGRFKDHELSLKSMFSKVDIYLAEGARDVRYAEHFGFNGTSRIFASAGGGYHIPFFKNYQETKPSKRNKIFVKGYQDSVRRGLVAIRALVRCADILSNYEIYVFSCSNEVRDYVEYVNFEKKITLKIYKEGSYESWIKSLSEACITITNNLSDGIPSTLFESMLTGAFPIQSKTSCADEWITNGENGMLVSPEDPEEIEVAIRKIIGNYTLIENAAKLNQKLISEKLNIEIVKERTIELYKTSVQERYDSKNKTLFI